MPARKTKGSATKSKSKGLTIGDIGKKISAIHANQVLYCLLLVAVFLIGYLIARVQFLEKGSTTATATAPSAPGQPQQPQAPSAPNAKDVLKKLSLGNFPVKGEKSAKVTLVEFADFRCPFCEQFFTNAEQQLIKDYVDTGKVAIYFRNYAFLGPSSIVAANAAECANDQGKFWEFHDWLYKNQPPETDTSMYNTDSLTTAAVNLGMNGDEFRNCLSSNKDNANVQKDLTDGQAVGVSGTPTFYVNGNQIVGAVPYDNFKTAIDNELKK